MRRFLPLATVLLVAAIAAGSPLVTAGAPPAAPAIALSPQTAAAPALAELPAFAPQAASTPQLAASPTIGGSAAVICILPRCNGPYCRASNGCWVCCTN